MPNPQQCKFAKTHEWIASDGTIGISDHAQKEMTDVVFVDLPKVGLEVKAGDACAVVESVKAAFDIYSPVSGKITKVNQAVSKKPALVNQSPYENGWLFVIEKSNPAEEAVLLSLTDYEKFIEEETNGH